MDLDPREVVECGKVGPGEVLVVDTRRGEVIRNLDAKREVAGRRPYARGCARYMATLVPDPARVAAGPRPARRCAGRSASFGYGFEDLRLVLEPMGGTGADAGVEHGRRYADSAALGGAAEPVRVFPAALRPGDQPADRLAPRGDGDVAPHAPGPPRLAAARAARATRRMLRLEHPVLLPRRWPRCATWRGSRPSPRCGVGPARGGRRRSGRRSPRSARAAERAARRGARILIISDRAADADPRADPDAARHRRRAAAPGAHRAAGARGPRGRGGRRLRHPPLRHPDRLRRRGGAPVAGPGDDGRLFGEAASVAARARGRGGAASLAGRSARAVPLGGGEGPAQDPVEDGHLDPELATAARRSSRCSAWATRSSPPASPARRRRWAASASRRSRRTCWRGTARRFRDPAAGAVAARSRPRALPEGGGGPRLGAADGRGPAAGREGERHRGVRRLSGQARARRPAGPRDLLGGAPGAPVPLEEVEPAEAIRSRFISSAMSLGALSPEAHATLSIAMNRMGARSNSGEGGEDPHNYHGFANGDRADNRIKQVASAPVRRDHRVPRPGPRSSRSRSSRAPSPARAASSPAHKVTDLIARLRHAVPGVSLISPPPHHDIYSIEDLAQLIHDLKTVNPRARVGVKLVSETGVGTVAAGVAKAYADYVLIAGHNGGTGASPLSSIKHAGSPWELGLAEAQATLVRNGLRAPDRGADRRRPQDRARRRDRGAARRRDVRLRHGAAGGDGLRHGPPVPHQHLSDRHRDPARRPARQVQGHARAGHHLLHAAGGGGAADPGADGLPQPGRDHRPERPAAADRAAGRAAGPDARSLDAAGDRRRSKSPRRARRSAAP